MVGRQIGSFTKRGVKRADGHPTPTSLQLRCSAGLSGPLIARSVRTIEDRKLYAQHNPVSLLSEADNDGSDTLGDRTQNTHAGGGKRYRRMHQYIACLPTAYLNIQIPIRTYRIVPVFSTPPQRAGRRPGKRWPPVRASNGLGWSLRTGSSHRGHLGPSKSKLSKHQDPRGDRPSAPWPPASWDREHDAHPERLHCTVRWAVPRPHETDSAPLRGNHTHG